MSMSTYYQILGVPFAASHEEVHDAFLALAKKWHPDLTQTYKDAAAFQGISEAYAALKNKSRRRDYDKGLMIFYLLCPSCKGRGKTMTGVAAHKTCVNCAGHGLKEKR